MNERISIDPDFCSGKPCFAGTRIMVHQLFEALQYGGTVAEFRRSFPAITDAHIAAAFAWASELVEAKKLSPVGVG